MTVRRSELEKRRRGAWRRQGKRRPAAAGVILVFRGFCWGGRDVSPFRLAIRSTMMMHSGPMIAGWCFAATILCFGQVSADDAIGIVFPRLAYRPGDRVSARIQAPGDVVIENDIVQQSVRVSVNGYKEVDLGVIRSPGVYTVRVISGAEAKVAVLLVHPQDGQLNLTVATESLTTPVAVPPGLVERFADGITKVRLRAAVTKSVAPWLVKNISSLGATATFGMVCIVPSGQFACPVAISSAGENVANLTLQVFQTLVTIMESDGVLTIGEADVLRKVAKLGQGGLGIVFAHGNVARALGSASFAVDVSIDNELATVLVGNAADQASKVSVLIKIIPK